MNRRELIITLAAYAFPVFVVYVACAFPGPMFVLLSCHFRVLFDLPFDLCLSYFRAPIVSFLYI